MGSGRAERGARLSLPPPLSRLSEARRRMRALAPRRGSEREPHVHAVGRESWRGSTPPHAPHRACESTRACLTGGSVEAAASSGRALMPWRGGAVERGALPVHARDSWTSARGRACGMMVRGHERTREPLRCAHTVVYRRVIRSSHTCVTLGWDHACVVRNTHGHISPPAKRGRVL